MSLLNTNNCYFVGTLVEVKELKEITYGDDNKEAVSATIVIKSNLENGESLTELRNFTNKYKKDGTINKNYNSILNINSLLNERVVVSGASIRGERFWSNKTNQLVPAVKYDFNMIRKASINDAEDKAQFEFGGFVARELTEITDTDGNVEYYQITIGQANYKEDNMHMIDFIVGKDNLDAVKAIQKSYTEGSTVSVSGVCSNIVTQITREEEVAFGAPVVKTFTRTDKKLIITSGSAPKEGEGEYTEDAIKTLVDAYTREGIKIKDNSTAKANVNTAEVAPKNVPSKKSALAGLI